MKVLGISFGRKMKCGDLLVKEALFKSKDAGADVQFINAVNMNIQHCKGCGACSAARDNGKQIKCIIKDDYQVLEDAVLDADAVIIAAPVYAVGPSGQFKNFVDRFGPAHDRPALEAEQNKRIAAGTELLDERSFRDKYVGLISVGGASTQNWVSLGLPTMNLFTFSLMMKVVGQIDAYDMGRTANPLLDQNLMDRVGELGKRVAEAVGKPYDEVEWFGEEGTCPVCHCNLISVTKTTTVECPICGIEGHLSVDGDKVNIEFSKEQQNRARGTANGLKEHYDEIQNMIKVLIPKLQANKETLPKMLEKYKNFDELTK
ncbi:FMN reductase [Clostridium gelidum]|uniref:FMN reductase n=1 Tax=Clostridium gelidum TaxID=704125 RepID=A0ABM7SZT8_9CLOT|nr:flavodoxin family protein [Clostridium gelidum]BCZ44983.1 FMN reductase [Clostridium gelidum]